MGNSVQKEFCRVRSPLMGGRSGCVSSFSSQMCGRGGVATMTFLQIGVRSTGRQSPHGLENWHEDDEFRARIEVLEKEG